MQLDQKALIEEAVQASIDAGLAVNGEHGVAAARHAARFMFNALQAVQPVPVVTDEMIRQAKKQIILAMQLYDFGSVSEDGAFTCSSQQIELLENRAEVAAHQALTAALTATASAEPVGYRWQWSVRNDGEWYYGPHHPVDGSQSSIDGDPDIIEPLYAAPLPATTTSEEPGAWQSMDTAPKGRPIVAGWWRDGKFININRYEWDHDNPSNEWRCKERGTCIRQAYWDDYRWTELPAAPLQTQGGKADE